MSANPTVKPNLSAEDLNDIVSSAVRAYTNRVWWARQPSVTDELYQEGWATLWAARNTWDPNVGVPFPAYAYRACILALRRVLWGISSPASGSRNKLRELAGAHHAPLDANEPERAPWADTLVEEAQWRERAKAALERVSNEGGEQVRLGIDVLLSEDKPAEYAQRTGIEVKRVYRATMQARTRLGLSEELYELAREKR